MAVAELGGYLELELRRGANLHSSPLRYATYRGALIAHLTAIKSVDRPLKIAWPHLNCPDVEAAVRCAFHDISLIKYHIGSDFAPILEAEHYACDIVYRLPLFGLGRAWLGAPCSTNFVDNAHAFFAKPRAGEPTGYSTRKFLGVPDGAYLYASAALLPQERYIAWERAIHLIRRIDEDAPSAYAMYRHSEEALASSSHLGMSTLTERLLSALDYGDIARRRLINFRTLHDRLRHVNDLTAIIDLALIDQEYVPFSYPLLISGAFRFRQQLISHRIYLPILWADSAANPLNKVEQRLVEDVLHLPIDQRYAVEEMNLMMDQLGLLGIG